MTAADLEGSEAGAAAAADTGTVSWVALILTLLCNLTPTKCTHKNGRKQRVITTAKLFGSSQKSVADFLLILSSRVHNRREGFF